MPAVVVEGKEIVKREEQSGAQETGLKEKVVPGGRFVWLTERDTAPTAVPETDIVEVATVVFFMFNPILPELERVKLEEAKTDLEKIGEKKKTKKIRNKEILADIFRLFILEFWN